MRTLFYTLILSALSNLSFMNKNCFSSAVEILDNDNGGVFKKLIESPEKFNSNDFKSLLAKRDYIPGFPTIYQEGDETKTRDVYKLPFKAKVTNDFFSTAEKYYFCFFTKHNFNKYNFGSLEANLFTIDFVEAQKVGAWTGLHYWMLFDCQDDAKFSFYILYVNEKDKKASEEKKQLLTQQQASKSFVSGVARTHHTSPSSDNFDAVMQHMFVREQEANIRAEERSKKAKEALDKRYVKPQSYQKGTTTDPSEKPLPLLRKHSKLLHPEGVKPEAKKVVVTDVEITKDKLKAHFEKLSSSAEKETTSQQALAKQSLSDGLTRRSFKLDSSHKEQFEQRKRIEESQSSPRTQHLIIHSSSTLVPNNAKVGPSSVKQQPLSPRSGPQFLTRDTVATDLTKEQSHKESKKTQTSPRKRAMTIGTLQTKSQIEQPKDQDSPLKRDTK